MRAFFTRAVFVWSALLMAASVSAQTQGLERVGPTSTANGFPTWYQDKTGIALEFCQPLSQGELDGGWCLLLPGDTTVPEQFPAVFADEHFFFAADANAVGGGIDALLVIGLEAAFAVGPVINGDQLVFARIRIRFDAPAAGTYTVYHPYGVDVLTAAQAGERIFFTEDIGIQCQGNFDCALKGRIGPFLLPSNIPGGVELPPVTGPVAGKLYIADPARLGPVTGSPLNQNYFRIVGPNGIIAETSDFSLMGRLFQGTMAGRVTVDRASYSRPAAGSLTGKTDVFATAFPTTPTRLPAAAPAPVVQPLLDFFPSACVANPNGTLGQPAGTPYPMVAEGSRHYGTISGVAIPAAVCVRDSTARDINGQVAPVFREAQVTDTVKITDASFVAATGTLSVTAQSSDADGPALSAELIGALANGTVSGPVVAPPARILVTSAKGGRAEAEVVTTEGMPTPPERPIANNDLAAVDEDSLANAINVLANDTYGLDPVVSITADGRLGTAVVVGNQVQYTPNANAFGNDLVSYTVTATTSTGSRVTSSPAFVSIAIRNVNDAPVAADDAIDGTAGNSIAINLFSNDTDADGAADLRSAVILSAPAGVVWSVGGGVLTVSGPAGTHTFTYQAQDAALAASNIATVTVRLQQTESLLIVRAEYIASKRRWRVEGTTDILTTHNVFISFADGLRADGTSAAGTLVGTAQAVGGLWALDLALAGANDPRVPTSTVYIVSPTRVYASTPGGLSQAIVFQLR